MAIDNAALFEDIMSVSKQRTPADIWKVEAEIIVNDISVPALRVERILNRRDYVSGYADTAVIQLSLGLITYSTKVYPNRNKLTIKVKRTRRSEFGSDVAEGDVYYTTYKATLIDAPDIDMLSKTKDISSYNEMELSNQLTLSFQLMESAIYEARLAEFAGIIRDAKSEDVIRVALGYGLDGNTNTSALGAGDYGGVRGVAISPPNNDMEFPFISIPVGTRIIDIVDLIQEEYGIYSSGAGCYFQSGYWYVFPLRDYTLFSKTKATLTIANLPEDQFGATQRSYRKDGKKLFVLSVGNTNIEDDSESFQLNSGNGIRYVRAGSIMDKMSDTSNNKTTLNRGDTLKEFLINERHDKLNNVRYPDRRITNNPYPAISSLTKGLGRELTLTWQNSDNSLLYPGMPVKVLYLKGGIVKEAIGTLIHSETIMTTKTTSITDNDYTSNSTLKVFVKPTE